MGFKYSTGRDDWQVHELSAATLSIRDEPRAAVVPSSIAPGASASLTLTRPPAQCCVGYDWIGIYEVGSTVRLAFMETQSTEPTVTLSLGSLLEGRAAGVYEFRYS